MTTTANTFLWFTLDNGWAQKGSIVVEDWIIWLVPLSLSIESSSTLAAAIAEKVYLLGRTLGLFSFFFFFFFFSVAFIGSRLFLSWPFFIACLYPLSGIWTQPLICNPPSNLLLAWVWVSLETPLPIKFCISPPLESILVIDPLDFLGMLFMTSPNKLNLLTQPTIVHGYCQQCSVE